MSGDETQPSGEDAGTPVAPEAVPDFEVPAPPADAVEPPRFGVPLPAPDAADVPDFEVPPPAADAVEPPPFEVPPPAPQAADVADFEVPEAVLPPPPPAADPEAFAVQPPAPAAPAPDVAVGAPASAPTPAFPSSAPSFDPTASPFGSAAPAFDPTASPFTSAASAPEPNADAYTQPPAGSYRGWTIAIFGGLGVLLVAAVIALIYLVGNVPLTWPSSDSDSTDHAPTVSVPEEPVTGGGTLSEASLIGECADLCTELSDIVTEQVTGQDGTTWVLSRPWESAESAGLPDAEIAVGSYGSSAGELHFTVWRFADDAAADAAYADLAAERGEPVESSSVYESGAGVRDSFEGDGSSSILWSVTGDETRPWVLLIEGPNDPAVFQFYLSLPV